MQTNWKASEHWEKQFTDEELENAFISMRDSFDSDGHVFKDTKSSKQFLSQAEIDVVGIEQDGTIHALDVAYHSAGLSYGGGTSNRVLKKMLRTLFVLETYHPADVERHIYFLSPKVNPGVQNSLEAMILSLRKNYSNINWHLLTNDDFTIDVLQTTLERADTVADTAELFVRSAKLLELGGAPEVRSDRRTARKKSQGSAPNSNNKTPDRVSNSLERVQPLVQGIMKTLLEDYPTLMDDKLLSGLLDSEFCKRSIGLRIGNYSPIRRKEEGREIGGYSRYWGETYGGSYFVCSQWGKRYHLLNAKCLLNFVSDVINAKEGHPGISSLLEHRSQLMAYVG